MINKLIVDGEKIELNESSPMPYMHTFPQAKVHTVEYGLDNTTEICAYAFKNCTELTKVVIPESIDTIKREAFMNCTSLPEITLHEKIKYIGKGAFDGCTSLKEIKFEGDENREPPEVYCTIPSQTICFVPDGSKYVEITDHSQIDQSGDIQYFTKTSWNQYEVVTDLTMIDDDTHYYRNVWDNVGSNFQILEDKNRFPVDQIDIKDPVRRVMVGDEVILDYKLLPENCTNHNLVWNMMKTLLKSLMTFQTVK